MGLFNSVEMRKPRSSKFDLTHERKMSIEMGKLTPIYVEEVVPGDRFRVSSEIFARMAPMLAPMMHRVNVYTHFFFVPNRLIWTEWEDFITGGKDGTLAPVAPYWTTNTTTVNSGLLDTGTLADYLGLPRIPSGTGTSSPLNFSALPFRAYLEIYNEYFRDQNLTTEIAFPKTSGLQVNTDFTTILGLMRQRAWEKDYFTSALPWAQRGNPVNIPIVGNATPTYKVPSEVKVSGGGNAPNGALSSSTGVLLANGAAQSYIDNISSISVSNLTATINDLRKAYRLQEFLEKNARGGARYIESNLIHFGVHSSDARLQRPEYLGGGKTPIVISEVLSNYQDPAGTGKPQGNMAGHGFAIGNTNSFSRRFEEHGIIIGVMSVLPRTAYQQGVPKMFTRLTDKYDYLWPEFAELGEQEIKMKELYLDTATGGNPGETTFGYQSRYSEYKYHPSTVHGSFRTSLTQWHMGRIFASQPALNTAFIESSPTNRIFAVTSLTNEQMYVQVINKVDAVRPLPYYGTPTF